MGRICKFKLLNGEECGLPISAQCPTRCDLHEHTKMGGYVGSADVVRRHLNENKHELIDLSGIAVRGVGFDNSFFSTDIPTIFQKAHFYDCTFDGCDFFDADFTWCTFGDCQFRNCTFRGTTCSFKVRLLEGSKTPFVGCFFDLERGMQSEVDFSGCNIRLDGCLFDACDVSASKFFMSFANIGFSSLNLLLHEKDGCLTLANYLGLNRVDIATFNQMRMTGDFAYRQYQGAVSLEPELHFRSVDFGRMRSAAFTRANLGKASFTDAAIESVVFIDPDWPESGGRMRVFDDKESLVGDAPGLKQVMALYVSLKKKYESARNYIDASDWFYREMECRRRLIAVNRSRVVRRLRQNIFSFLPWYKYISSYGENYTRPLWCIGSVLTLFAMVYFYWTGYPTDSGPVNYAFAFEFNDGAVGDFLGAVAFSAGIMLLQFLKLAAEQPSPTPVLAVIQVVFTLILVPLFLLALRRKFRR